MDKDFNEYSEEQQITMAAMHLLNSIIPLSNELDVPADKVAIRLYQLLRRVCHES